MSTTTPNAARDAGGAAASGRIDATFARLRAQGRTALIPYVMAGDPAPDATVPILHALAAGGADIIELGVPFSDPMADGPVIQKAAERALARGVKLAQVLAWVAQFRERDATTPVVLMGYANPVEQYERHHGAGVDGVLIVDYPPQESAAFDAQLQQHGLAPIFLLAPTSTDARIEQVARVARGYVYYVSLAGVTGAGTLDTSAVAQALPRIRRHVRIPVGVGFGIRDGASARRIAEVADAVVIGSRLVDLLHAGPVDNAPAAAQALAQEIRQALDGAGPSETER